MSVEPKFPEVEQIRKYDEDNLEASIKYLGESYTLVHDVTELYILLSDLLSTSQSPIDLKFHINCTLFLSCQYQFTTSCLAVLRAHLTDSFRSTRRAIESCAFSYRIFKHPHLAEVWLNAGDSDESYKKYREKFSGKNLFPEKHEVMKFLGDRYDFCSKQMHSTLHSFVTRMITEEKEKSLSFKFPYYDIPKDDPVHFFRAFFATINIHRHILKVFSEVFQEDIKQDKVTWEVHYNAVEVKYGVHLAPWRDTMVNYLE